MWWSLVFDVLALAIATVVGYLAVADPNGPAVRWPPLARYASFLAVAGAGDVLLRAGLRLLEPLFLGRQSLDSVLLFLSGVIFFTALVGVYFVLSGAISVQTRLPRFSAGPTFGAHHPAGENFAAPPGAAAAGATPCPRCRSPVRPGAQFCAHCGQQMASAPRP